MLNKAVVQGRLTRDPELRTTTSGTAGVSCTVAWSEKYKEQERKLFMNCIAWGGNAEFVSKYFRKGAEAVVEGALNTRSWEDQNGNKREVIELNADKIHFCGPKQETAKTREEVPEGFEEVDEDDLPF